MRFRMIDTERSRSAGVILWFFGGTALQHHLEATLQVEPEPRLLVDGRARHDDQAGADQRRQDQADQDQIVTALAHGSISLALSLLGWFLLGAPSGSSLRLGQDGGDRAFRQPGLGPGRELDGDLVLGDLRARWRRSHPQSAPRRRSRTSSIIDSWIRRRRRCGLTMNSQIRNSTRTIRMKKPPFTMIPAQRPRAASLVKSASRPASIAARAPAVRSSR